MATDRPGCATCRHWLTESRLVRGEIVGVCKRYPPIVAKLGEMTLPVTAGADWCGEYAPKPIPISDMKG